MRRWHVSANWDLIVILSLGQNLADNPTVNVGQPAVDAVVAECESLMVDPQKMQDRGVQIVAVGAAFHALIAELIALPVARSRPKFRTGKPGDEVPPL